VDKNVDNPPHPAKFSDPILEVIAPHVLEARNILDPFGGVGKVGLLKKHGVTAEITSNELEPEWAKQGLENGCDKVRTGDALLLGELFPEEWDAIVTSPVYGNRMSDHHDAKDKSKRITYRHRLGRPLTQGNSGMLQWGTKYKKFHIRAWREILKALRPGGTFVLNCSNHIRSGEEQMVTQWHAMILQTLHCTLLDWFKVDTQRMGFGENRKARVSHESVIIFQKR
jgi:hypothetical protein